MSVQTINSWLEEFSELTNNDMEIQAHGTYYSCSFLLDMEKEKILIRMHKGKIEYIKNNPKPLDDYQFSIIASAETWRKFSQPVPPPMYHGIWSATFQSDMSLEGDILVLMQNLRCITRHLELLRKVGSPV